MKWWFFWVGGIVDSHCAEKSRLFSCLYLTNYVDLKISDRLKILVCDDTEPIHIFFWSVSNTKCARITSLSWAHRRGYFGSYHSFSAQNPRGLQGIRMRTCSASTCTNWRTLYAYTMASKQKRQKFDPLAQKQSHRSQKTTGEKIKEACHQFWKALSEATFNCKPIPFAELSSTETELVLVSILGLRGVSALKCAMQIVPSQLCKEDRLQYISNIVTVAAVPISSVPNTQDVIESFIPHSDKVAYFHQGGEAIANIMWSTKYFLHFWQCSHILLSPTCILLHKQTVQVLC